MSEGNSNNRPVADLVAIVPATDGQGNPKDSFVTLCPLWKAQTDTGNLTGTLEVEPIAWRNPREPRRIIIQFRRGN